VERAAALILRTACYALVSLVHPVGYIAKLQKERSGAASDSYCTTDDPVLRMTNMHSTSAQEDAVTAATLPISGAKTIAAILPSMNAQR
jgi:hypothetical protein